MDPLGSSISFFQSEWKWLLSLVVGLVSGLGFNKLPLWWLKQKIMRRQSRKRARNEWISTTRDFLNKTERLALDYQLEQSEDYLLELKREFGTLSDSLHGKLEDPPKDLDDETVKELERIVDQVVFLASEPTDGVTKFGDNQCFCGTADACLELVRDFELPD